MQIVQLQQGTPEWHDWRRGGIGGSDMPVLFQRSRFKTRHQLWLEKQGLAKSDDGTNSYIKQRGHRVEAEMRDYASNILDEPLAVTCVQGNLPWQRVSMDGITSDMDTAVEAKLLKRDAFEALRDRAEVPAEYAPQLRHILDTTGARRLLLVGRNDALDKKAHTFVSIAHPALADLDTIRVGTEFWKLVEDGTEPEPDESEIVEITDAEALALADQFRVAKEYADKHSKEAEALAKQLKALAGENRVVRFGKEVRVVRFPKKGNVQYKNIPQLSGVDLDAFRSKTRFEQRIDIV